MDPVRRAVLVADRGITGNADQGGLRQVTLVEREVIESIATELGMDIDPAVRRANVLVSGLSLAESRGRILRLGAVRIRIAGETRPCRRKDEAVPGLRDALARPWCGGAYGAVLADGEIAVGDPVGWSDG